MNLQQPIDERLPFGAAHHAGFDDARRLRLIGDPFQHGVASDVQAGIDAEDAGRKWGVGNGEWGMGGLRINCIGAMISRRVRRALAV